MVPFELKLLEARFRDELRPNLGNPKREDPTLRMSIERIKEGLLGSYTVIMKRTLDPMIHEKTTLL